MIDIRLKELSKLHEAKHVERIQSDTGGIYLLYNILDELVYVGRSQNLKNRLLSHFNGKTHTVNFHKDFYYFRVMYTNSRYEQRIYELYAINEYKPFYNRADVFEDDEVHTEIKEEKDLNIDIMINFVTRFMNKNKSVEISIGMIKDLLKRKKIKHDNLFHPDTLSLLEKNGVYLMGRGFVKK